MIGVIVLAVSVLLGSVRHHRHGCGLQVVGEMETACHHQRMRPLSAIAFAAICFSACNSSSLVFSDPTDAFPDTTNGPAGPDLAPPGCFALHVQGDGEKALAPFNGVYDSANSLTVEAWIWGLRPLGTRESQVIVSHRRDRVFTDGYELAIGPKGTLRFTLVHSDAQAVIDAAIVEANDALPTDQWVHVAGVANTSSNKVDLFINGIQSQQLAMPLVLANQTLPLTMGASDYDQAYGFAGYVAEVRVSSVARYSGAFAPARRFTTDADTLALFHFDEPRGTVAHDSSAQGNDATLLNGATFAMPPACR